MLYRQVVPGVVGMSGAANAEAALKKQIAIQTFRTKLIRMANRPSQGTASPVRPLFGKPSRGNGGLETAVPCSMIRKCCESSHCSFWLFARLALQASLLHPTAMLLLWCGMECAQILSARKPLPRFGSLHVKELLFAIIMRFIPARHR